MFNKLKQIKDLRDQAKKMQDTLSGESAEGTADWGKIKVKMDGNMKVLSVSIDDSLLSNRSKLENSMVEAMNDATKKVQKVMVEKMKDMGTLPDLLKK
ncbi:MAG: YbaB/EbfC family nucleoid-associated protein [bacterium]